MSQPSSYPLALSGDLSLRAATGLPATLREALAGHASVAVDTSAVDSIDVAALQILVAAARTAAAQGRGLSLSAAAGSPMARALIGAGFFSADGALRVPSLSSWTITREAA